MKIFQLAVLIALAATPVASQQSPDGAVAGTVKHFGSSEPIPNANVTLFPFDGWTSSGVPAGIQLDALLLRLMPAPSNTAQRDPAQPERPTLKGMTDASGRFVFAKVTPGYYGISVDRDGFMDPRGSVAGLGARTSPFEVLPGQTFNAISVSLTQGRVISGTVRDSNSNPAVGVRVSAFQGDYRENTIALTPVGIAKSTDDRGEYRLFGLLPGEYIVGTLPPTGGSAVDTVSYGQTFFPNRLDPRAASPVILREGADSTSIDIGLQKAATTKISGRVINSIAGDSGQIDTVTRSFYLVPRGNDWRAVASLPDPARNFATDQTDGKFELRGVPPGSYDLVAIPRFPGRAAADPRGGALGRTQIDVANDDISGVTLTIVSGVDVKARITYQGEPPASVTPRPTILLQEAVHGVLYSLIQLLARPPATTVADSTGITTFHNRLAGLYRLTVSGLPPNASIIDIREGGKSVYDTGLSVGEVPPGLVEIAVNLEAGGVEGTVVNEVQQAVRSVRVVLLPPPSRRGNPSLYKTSLSDLSGHFTLRGVAPGEYKIFAWENLPRGVPYLNSEFMSRWEARGQTVTVGSAGMTAAVRVQVIPSDGTR